MELNPILHQLVWDNLPGDLETLLSNSDDAQALVNGPLPTPSAHPQGGDDDSQLPFIDRKFRGITALGLACQLGRTECAQVLLEHGASCYEASAIGFMPFQDANGWGERELMRLLFRARHSQLQDQWAKREALLHQVLCMQVPDFYLEMGWEFFSWLPFVSMLCPNDRCLIWKQGPNVRIDTTLVGFERLSWIRGNVTFLLRVDENESKFFIIDHDKKIYEDVDRTSLMSEEDLDMQINLALNTEMVFVEVEQKKKVDGQARGFDRQQAGFFGMGGDREDLVAGFKTAVWDIPDVEIITRKRKEHLRDRDPNYKSTHSIFTELDETTDEKELQMKIEKLEVETKEDLGGYMDAAREKFNKFVPSVPPPQLDLDSDSFFAAGFNGPYAHQGRKLEMSETRKVIHPSVWMAQNFPLTIADLMPIFEIMSPTGKHFERLKSFISLDMPPGFPVKLEVPIFAFLTGRVTFENYQDWMEGLSKESIPAPKSVGADMHTRSWFSIPADYQKGQIIKGLLKMQEEG